MATHSNVLAWRFPKDRGAWWATVHVVTESQTGLSKHITAQHSTGSLNLGDKGQCVTHNYNVISKFSQMPFIRNGDPLPLLACDILS